ncbi:hypothetical protein GOP47_0021017 [Adiantum capillus-veneris]|uniref:Uncharacterized protein n=1 Tax=Adiantum capillus-veneris TaxID=13818 RepID=A0A9D4UB29_ADICA|nr:hypothetical protein GOP47_0021017 [Adiantum capillus-veneris]
MRKLSRTGQGVLDLLVVISLGFSRVSNCLELNSELGSSVSLLDTGLTALSSLAVLGTTLLRGRLDVEHPMRDIWSLRPRELLLQKEIIHTDGICNSSVLIIVDSKIKEAVQVLLDTLVATTDFPFLIVFVQTGDSIDQFRASCNNADNHACECVALPEDDEEQDMHMLWQLVHPTGLVWTDHNGGTAYQLCSDCMDWKCHDAVACDMPLRRPVPLDWSGITPIEGNLIGEFWSYQDRELHENSGIMISGYNERNTEFFRYLGENMVMKDHRERLARSTEEDLLLNPSNRLDNTDYGSLMVTPNVAIISRVVELVAMAFLTIFFRVDPISSGLVGRRLVRNYVVGSQGNSYALQGLVRRIWFGHSRIVSLQTIGFQMAWNTKFQALLQGYLSVIGAICVSIAWCICVAFDFSAFNFATMYGQVSHHLLRYGLLITVATVVLSTWVYPYIKTSYLPSLKPLSTIILLSNVVACIVMVSLDYKFEFLALPKVAFPLFYVIVLACWLGGTKRLGRNVLRHREQNELISLPYCCSYLANFWMIASGGKWR